MNYMTNFRSACQECWVYRTAALCEYAGARNLIGANDT